MSFAQIVRSVDDDSDDFSVAARFYEELPLKWTWAYNLTRDEEILIPFNWFYTINEFNGPSAGNCIEEALLQGICEIVEISIREGNPYPERVCAETVETCRHIKRPCYVSLYLGRIKWFSVSVTLRP